MRVLMINQVFYPDVAATAQHAHDLARHLVRHGHEVDVIASRSIYGEKGAALRATETVDGVGVHRVARSLFGKSSIAARVLDFGLFYAMAMAKALRVKRPDVVVCFTTPPFIALLGILLRTFRGSKAVYWVMDLYPDLPVACGVMRARSPVTRVFERLNRSLLRRSDRVVVLGRCMLQRVRAKGVDHGQVTHIGVWSDQTEVAPVPRGTNPYRAQWNLGDRFVVMYSGNFGLGHDVDTMCSAAEKLKDDDSVRFVFVGGGKKKAIVEAFVRDRGLTNCVIAPYQPRERLGESLSCADLHLVTLTEGIEGIMVPCKLFGIMASERPCLFIGNPTSELALVLMEHDAGLTVRQGDATGLVSAIHSMRNDSARRRIMGENARRALGLAYSRETACEQWRSLLEEVAGVRASPSAVEPARKEEVIA